MGEILEPRSGRRTARGFFIRASPSRRAKAAPVAQREPDHLLPPARHARRAADRLIFATPDRPRLNNNGQVSDDGRWLIVNSSSGTDSRYEINLDRPQATPKATPRRADPRASSNNWGYIGNPRLDLLFRHRQGRAARRSIVASTSPRPSRRARRSSPRTRRRWTASSLVGGKLIADYLADAKTEVRVHTLDRLRWCARSSLPGHRHGRRLRRRSRRSRDLLRLHQLQPADDHLPLRRRDRAGDASGPRRRLAFNPDDYAVEQRFYASKDGTRVPMFIVKRQGRDRARADLALRLWRVRHLADARLLGRRGWPGSRRAASTRSPTFAAAANMARPGTMPAGSRNKQNVFDDFIAAGEYLKAQRHHRAARPRDPGRLERRPADRRGGQPAPGPVRRGHARRSA